MPYRFERLSDVPLSRMTQIWNEGFSDYYVQIPMTPSSFAAGKFGNEDVKPEHSFVAFEDGDDAPVGFLLNATRMIDGRLLAWNAGTAVRPDRRGRGVGKALLERAVAAYRELGVRTAYLEAFVQNERAVALYRSNGYEAFDTLHMMSRRGGAPRFLENPSASELRLEPRPASYAARFDYAKEDPVWQARWQSLKTGEALVAYAKADGAPRGYALFRRIVDAEGAVTGAALYQCVASPQLPPDEAETAIRALLQAAYAMPGREADGGAASAGAEAGAEADADAKAAEPPRDAAADDDRAFLRYAFGVPASHPTLLSVLESAGFETGNRLVHMRLRL